MDYKRVFTVAPRLSGNIFCVLTKSGENWSDTYYHYDAIGNMVMTSSSQGEVDSCFEQEAYGNVKSGSQSGYHLTTKEYDSIPELYYFWQRWYDPVLGRFLSKSLLPIFIEHPFKFCSDNTLNMIDIDGNKDLEDAIRKRIEKEFLGWMEKYLGKPVPKVCKAVKALQECVNDCFSFATGFERAPTYDQYLEKCLRWCANCAKEVAKGKKEKSDCNYKNNPYTSGMIKGGGKKKIKL